MSSLPIWAFWSIIVAGVLLSPALAFLLAVAIEVLIGCLVDAGMPALLMVGAGVGGLLLFRKLRMGSREGTSAKA